MFSLVGLEFIAVRPHCFLFRSLAGMYMTLGRKRVVNLLFASEYARCLYFSLFVLYLFVDLVVGHVYSTSALAWYVCVY